MAILLAQQKYIGNECERRQCMKVLGESLVDIRHTQGVEMHFQLKSSMKVVPECEQT